MEIKYIMKENTEEILSCINDITNLRNFKNPPKELVTVSVQEAMLKSYHRHEEYKAKSIPSYLKRYLKMDSEYLKDKYFLVYQDYPNKYPTISRLENWFRYDAYLSHLLDRIFYNETFNAKDIKVDFKLAFDDVLFIVIKDTLNDRTYQEVMFHVEVLYRSKNNG